MWATASPAPAQAPEAARYFTDPCHEGCEAWTATAPGDVAAARVTHEPSVGADAPGCAQALWANAAPDSVLRFDRPLPPNAALEELTASLAVYTGRRCAAGVRVRFPFASRT